jgi:hypothetical protein
MWGAAIKVHVRFVRAIVRTLPMNENQNGLSVCPFTRYFRIAI